jgi:hypothetical protein
MFKKSLGIYLLNAITAIIFCRFSDGQYDYLSLLTFFLVNSIFWRVK